MPELRDRRRPHDGAASWASPQRDVASDLLVSLSSSAQVAPNYWLDPKRGVQYLVAVQTPQYRDRLASTRSATTPLSTGDGATPQLLGERRDGLAHDAARRTSPTTTSRRTFDVQANVDGTDLGSVADARRTRSSPS